MNWAFVLFTFCVGCLLGMLLMAIAIAYYEEQR